MTYFLIFIFGLAIGSFLNVVICRLETKESVLGGRSYCPKCKESLKWFNLIPVFSFLIQKGKCCACGQKISWQYPVVEISTGLLFIFVIGGSPQLGAAPVVRMTFDLIILSLLIIIFVYDLKHYIIPDRIIYPAIIIALIYLIYSQSLNPLWAGLAASGFFLGLVLISKGQWMGWGDVKLVFLMGLILSWPNIIIALFLSFAFGAMIGLGLVLLGRKKLKSQIPFGPFLVGSTLITMFASQQLINWYQGLFF